MPANQDVQDFYELRSGFQGMSEFANAALRFLDKFGIAVFKPSSNGHATNGHANGNGRLAKDVDALREKVTRRYTKRRYTKRRYTKHAPTPAVPATTPPPVTTKMTGAERRIAGRLASAMLLDGLDRVEPRPSPTGKLALSLGALVRRGYAKKKGNGYIRTAKVFIADDRKRLGRHKSPAPAAPAELGDTLTATEAAQFLKLSDTYIRSLVKEGRLAARKELRVRKGGKKPLPRLILDRADVERFAAEHNFQATPA